MTCVLQPWVCELSMMQQSVLIAAVRGPDGIHKNHISKLMLRWFRRCILYSAFDGRILIDPVEKGGGSFTGPSVIDDSETGEWPEEMMELLDEYLHCVDMLPHHFQLHFMHAAEILGYKHPNKEIRDWWNSCYWRLVNDMHLYPETEEQMDKRLGDNEADWRAREEVTAQGPSK